MYFYLCNISYQFRFSELLLKFTTTWWFPCRSVTEFTILSIIRAQSWWGYSRRWYVLDLPPLPTQSNWPQLCRQDCKSPFWQQQRDPAATRVSGTPKHCAAPWCFPRRAAHVPGTWHAWRRRIVESYTQEALFYRDRGKWNHAQAGIGCRLHAHARCCA